MRYLVLLLMIAINFILETTILPYLSFFGVVPNTSLVLIIIIAILVGKRIGSITGIIAGFLQDIMFSSVIGINSFIYFVIAYLIGIAQTKLYKESYLLPVLITVISTLGYHLLHFIFLYFLNYDVSLISILKEVTIIEIIYNCIVSILLYKPILRLFSSPSIRFIRK